MVPVLNALGAVEYGKGKYEEAELLYLSAIKIQEGARGPLHDSIHRTLHNLGLCYAGQGRYREAEAAYRRSLAIAEQSFGVTHPDMPEIFADYAAALRKLRKKDEARALEKHARELRARLDRENASRFEVDWRDLRNR